LGSLADLCCPLVNFFESEASALAFLAGRPNLDAAIVPIPEAIDLGRAVFEGLVG
jgi:hypothetical protein